MTESLHSRGQPMAETPLEGPAPATQRSDWFIGERYFRLEGISVRVFDVEPALGDVLDPALAGGWLSFARAGERRRIAPIPRHWASLSDEELGALWRQARSVPRVSL
jgi:hypothetical protein